MLFTKPVLFTRSWWVRGVFGSSGISFISNHSQSCSEGTRAGHCLSEIRTGKSMWYQLQREPWETAAGGGAEPVPCRPEAGQSLPGLCKDTVAVGKPGHWESRDSTAQRAQPGTSSSRQIVQDSVSNPFSPQCLLLTPCRQMLLKALQSSNRNQANS